MRQQPQTRRKGRSSRDCQSPVAASIAFRQILPVDGDSASFLQINGRNASLRTHGRTGRKFRSPGLKAESAGTSDRRRTEPACSFGAAGIDPGRIGPAEEFPHAKGSMMRLKLTLSVLAVIALSTVSAAGDNAVPVQPASTSGVSVPVVHVSQSRGGIFQSTRRQSSGFFGRIMEVERRKNAWLRRSFSN